MMLKRFCSCQGLRLEDRFHHLADHHGLVGPGRGGHRRQLLAHGLPSKAQDRGPTASSGRVPQPSVHDARASGRANAGLPTLKNQIG